MIFPIIQESLALILLAWISLNKSYLFYFTSIVKNATFTFVDPLHWLFSISLICALIFIILSLLQEFCCCSFPNSYILQLAP